jgi:hypothetical protein
VLLSEHRRVKATASNVHQRLKEDQIYFSRELPAAEKRRQTIEKHISALLDHPMAFFSHFNEMLSPEVKCSFHRFISFLCFCFSFKCSI